MEGKRDANILITGTPGTGKTTLSELVASNTQLRHINVTDLVKEKSLHEGKNEEFDSYILDEDKVLRFFHLEANHPLIARFAVRFVMSWRTP
jgi:broad-specificity NMP kinase